MAAEGAHVRAGRKPRLAPSRELGGPTPRTVASSELGWFRERGCSPTIAQGYVIAGPSLGANAPGELRLSPRRGFGILVRSCRNHIQSASETPPTVEGSVDPFARRFVS
jgi:hypothetical protein